VILAADTIGDLEGRSALVVGAGSMARGVVDFLISRGVGHLAVLNRTASRAADLIEPHAITSVERSARAGGLSSLSDELVIADVAFCATSSPLSIIGVDMISEAMGRRDGRPLTVIDIAMPRNVELGVADIDGVILLDMEALAEFAERGLTERRREIPAVREIVEEELDRYEAATSAREIAPLIVELRSRADQLVADEMSRQGSKLAAMTPAERDAVEAMVRGVVAKLLHEPTIQLKDAAGTLRGERLAGSLRELFDL
jgi:glutamyl-tRNA reductase